MRLFSHSVRLFNPRPRSNHSCLWLWCCLPPALGCWGRHESVLSPLSAAGDSLESKAAQSKANGCDFDEFSTNIFFIYICGQVRLTCLPKKISIYLCIKESIAPFWQVLKMKCSQLLFQYFSTRRWGGNLQCCLCKYSYTFFFVFQTLHVLVFG